MELSAGRTNAPESDDYVKVQDTRLDVAAPSSTRPKDEVTAKE